MSTRVPVVAALTALDLAGWAAPATLLVVAALCFADAHHLWAHR